MWDRIRRGRSQAGRASEGMSARTGRRLPRQPMVESLEGRQLLANASLAPIANQTVPAQQGMTIPLDGSGTTDNQTFQVTSSNPAIAASIVSGPIWTVDVSYTDTANPSSDFSGPLVFQLFNNANDQTLTNSTVNMISQFTNDGFYVNTGYYFNRIVNLTDTSGGVVVQGGSTTPTGSGSSGQPNTPFFNQNFQQLAFTGSNQLAMANAGGTDSNDSQFFITTGDAINSALGYGYTIFGQMIPNPTNGGTVPSDQTTLTNLTNVPVMTNTVTGEDSQPVYNPIITSATLSSTDTDNYPSGTLLIDTSQATAGETGTITVTATDPTSGTSVTQTFTVTVGAYAGPTDPSINFKPFANAVTTSVTQNSSGTVTLNGTSGYPDTTVTPTLTYSLVSQPADGTVTNFNPSTGTFTYTPHPGFTGTDKLTYDVTQDPPSQVTNGPNGVPVTETSNPATVTINVAPPSPVDTGAVRVVGTVLIVTPLPKVGKHVKNTIDVVQVPSTATSTTPVIEVFVNGQLDTTEPAVSSIDDIIVFGSKASDDITIDPSVTIPSVIDGGHGGHNVLQAGSTETLEHGWFGHNVLKGGTGPNQMIGRAGHVKFKPTKSTDYIFAGTPNRRTHMLNPTPPSGTFYVFKKGRLIPVPLSRLYPGSVSVEPISTGSHHKK